MKYLLDLEGLRPYALDTLARDPLPGADGVRAETIKNVDDWLKPVLESISKDEYQPQPYLRFWMKIESKQRPIDCPSLIDRVLMAWFNAQLISQLSPHRGVYGISGQGWQKAISEIEAELARGDKIFGLSFDIKAFFPSIDHALLLKALLEKLPESLVELVESWLIAPSIEGDRIVPHRDGLGLPQGLSVSPHLAQLYLEPFDRLLESHAPNLRYFRYLDDCLLLGHDRRQLEEIKSVIAKWLKEIGLKLNLQKVELGDMTQGQVSYLNHTFPKGKAHHSDVEQAKVTFVGSSQVSLSTELARYALKKLSLDDTLWEKGAAEGLSVSELLSVELERAGRTIKWYQNAQLRRPLRTLYIVNTPAKVRIERGALIVHPSSNQGESRELPLSHVGQIVAMGPVEMSSGAMRYCLREDVPVLFLSNTGSYFGRLDSAKRTREPLLERQFRLRDHPERQLNLAKAMITGRLDNARILLSRNNRKEHRRSSIVDEVIKEIKRAKVDLRYARSLDEIRGIEGRATLHYWRGYAELIPSEGTRRDEPPHERRYESNSWDFNGRNRRPPLDPVNSLISFVAVLLTYNIYSIIELCGLTPYVGVLHSSSRRAPALAFDLIEEFRAPLVESVVLNLVGKKVVTLNDFEWRDTGQGEGVFLTRTALRKVIKTFELAMGKEREHPHFGLRGDMRRMIHLQVLHFAACLERDTPYTPFVIR